MWDDLRLEGGWAVGLNAHTDAYDAPGRNLVLLVWGQTTVCFPGIWPADEALVINGTFEDPPLRLTFPVPLDGDAKPVRDVVWSADKLIVDGSPYDLVAGDSYVFTEDGLEALSSDAADAR
jgi:hypothetical protein